MYFIGYQFAILIWVYWSTERIISEYIDHTYIHRYIRTVENYIILCRSSHNRFYSIKVACWNLFYSLNLKRSTSISRNYEFPLCSCIRNTLLCVVFPQFSWIYKNVYFLILFIHCANANCAFHLNFNTFPTYLIIQQGFNTEPYTYIDRKPQGEGL